MELFLKPAADYLSSCFELNCDMYNLLESLTISNKNWYDVIKLSGNTERTLSRSPQIKSRLLNSPILCTLPLFTTSEEWNELFCGDTKRLADTFSLAPTISSQVLSTDVRFTNKFYLNHLTTTARTSPLSMLELGVPFETIEILRNVTVEQKNNALSFKLPLFKWRFTELQLEESTNDEFPELEWIQYLIQTTPANLSNLEAISDVAKRYHSETAYPLAEQLIRYNMRATMITSLLPNLHSAKIRDMYQRILDESSSCGKRPSSYLWYFVSERRRAHTSLYVLLYRLAAKSGLGHIQSIIAAYGSYLAITKDEPLSINRLALIVGTLQTGSGLIFVASCRNCSANYLLSNTDEKQEFAHHFHCERCVTKRSKGEKKSQPNRLSKIEKPPVLIEDCITTCTA